MSKPAQVRDALGVRFELEGVRSLSGIFLLCSSTCVASSWTGSLAN